jgi:transcription initiation factor TFIIE subunit alpha
MCNRKVFNCIFLSNKMLNDLLKEVVVLVVGKPAEPIADLLDSKKHVNEFIIAKKLDITINQTRNILYKLSDQGLVSSERKKDKKKGWYTYFWRIEVHKALTFLRGHLQKRVDQIEQQVNSRETKQFYVCERCSIEFNEENALLHNFTCNECGDVFTIKDNAKLIKELKKILNRLKKEIEEIDKELDKENEKIEKEREKVRKKEAKEKAEEKAKKAAIRKRLKAKEAKAAGIVLKKPVKKKAKKKSKKKAVKKKPSSKTKSKKKK